jgi:hypothetical protein
MNKNPVHFLAPYPLFGTKQKPLSVSYQQRSPFYWWWAYLRRNIDYLKCCEKNGAGKLAHLYKEFGDVRDDDFKKWWSENNRGAYLFGEKRSALIPKELNDKSEWEDDWNAESVLVIALPLTMGKRELQNRFAKILTKRHSAKRGRTAKKLNKSTARFPLNRNYTIENLQKALDVYDCYARLVKLNGKAKLWEVGVELRLVRTAMPSGKDLKQDTAVKRNVMAASVKRYLKQAEMLIASTSLGVFPG